MRRGVKLVTLVAKVTKAAGSMFREERDLGKKLCLAEFG
jgi:hypothetical protein